MSKYFLYILRCADKTLYTGITTDLNRRVSEHNSTSRGAKYTCGRRPVRLVYSKEFTNRSARSAASKEEARLKKLSRLEKLEIIRLSKKI